MRNRTLRIIYCACLLLPCLAAAQNAPSADPITGTWIGDAAPGGATSRTAITVQLTYDGQTTAGSVTGPARPGTVRSGSFTPATGRLRFEVHLDDAGTSPFVFDGTVVTGTAIGQVTGDGVTGNFRITRTDGTPSRAEPMRAEVRGGFDEVSGWITKAANLVPAERWGYRPVATVRTFAEVVAHIADAYGWYCARAEGRDVPWSDAIAQGDTRKVAVMSALERAVAACNAAYEAGQNTGALMANVAHANLHYGNLVTYIRMVGLVPPSS
jgi:uncharacterized damage-inducible protein DinB